MKVAINGRFLLPRLEGIGHYTFQLIDHLSAEHPEDEIHILLDRVIDLPLFSRSNIQTHIIYPSARHPILWFYWFEIAIPRLLSKIQANVFFSPDGYLSLKTDVPTIMTIHDLAYLHYPKATKNSHRIFLKKYIPKYIARANAIACVSSFTKSDLVTQFPKAESKLVVIPNGVSSSFRQLTSIEIASCRNRISGGKPYFLYLGSVHPRKNVARLIKAYDEYKRRKGGEIRLVLAGRMAWNSKEVELSIKQSPFKQCIILIDTIDETIPQIVGAAHSMCYISLFEGFGLPVLEAMACGIPVVTSVNSAMTDVCSDHAVYVDPSDISSMVDGLVQVSENESLRKKLIKGGLEQARQFNWSSTANGIHKLLQSVSRRD